MKARVKRHAVTQPLDKPYRFIPLTQGQNAIVDAADFEWLNQWNWKAQWTPHMRCFYATRSYWTDGHSHGIKMHRLILGCSASEEGDHKNGNTLDNRRSNLRRCSRQENSRNYRKPKTNKSGYKGVQFEKGKWSARIRIGNKRIRLGSFTSPGAAAEAYDAAARLHHGDFANLNS